MPPQKVKGKDINLPDERSKHISPELLEAMGVVSGGLAGDFDSPVQTPLPQDYPKNAGDDIDKADLRMPVPVHPWLFQKDPLIRGGQKDLATAYQTIIKRTPSLGTGNVKQINSGPTKASMEKMKASGLPEEMFTGTSLGGIYDSRDKQIGINPSLMGDPEALQHVLTHELMHSKGKPEGITTGMDIMYNILRNKKGLPMDDYRSRYTGKAQ